MADFLLEKPGEGEDVADTLIRLYKTLSVMLSSLDSNNVTSLETGKTKISSGDGLCEIDGAKIVMCDAGGVERLVIGADKEGNFMFILKNKLGDDSLTLSSEGDAVFSGDIKTEKNAEVGNSIYLGRDDNSAGVKCIQFYDDEENDIKKVRIEVTKDEGGNAGLKFVADTITLASLSGVYDAAGNNFVTATERSAYVEIGGVQYPVIFR